MKRLFLLAAGVCVVAQGATEKIVFDTDPLLFTDDAHAAVMLLRSPEKVSMLGITVVSGNAWGAEGADYMWEALAAIGRTDVPIHLGAQAPLVHTLAMAKE
jgi:purine nucleosidase